MKRFALGLTLILMLPLSAAAGRGTCPPSPSEGIEGEIRCGHIHCGNLQRNASYQGGGVCQYNPQYYCMVDCIPMRTMESIGTMRAELIAEKLDGGHLIADVQIFTRDGRLFDGKPGRVEMYVNGHATLEGRYVDTPLLTGFQWDNGRHTDNTAQCSPEAARECSQDKK